ncbi:hypothetical protein GCM10011519_23600 [Marmoricola endophyticus]|uniref:IPT/TIG domain-containing protein n=1 Tax=Marmoricola endophyticus TaxID=2040280 RepID=A0A917F6M6_9ACTN|nr:IPT/TIG domain-containing protein [Marmoricola endophyticus]GGF48862.1 hypothetical protein GCM10011519_23600 [Marmoricola endophyticus]
MDEQQDERNDLERPVDPPSGVRRFSGERHLTRRVIAPACLLLVSVPVVALLFLNLRSVSGDSSPASANVGRTSTATSSPTPTPSTPTTPTPSAAPSTPPPSTTPTPTAPPTPAGPRVTGVSATSGPAAGGTVLTVTGTDLGAITQVLFGALNGANLQHESDSHFTVTVPAGAAGAVPLQFKTGADDAASAITQYVYR